MSSTNDSPAPVSTENPILNAIGSTWWILLLRGILLIILGLYALFNPGLTLLAWAFMIGCFLIADGILAIVAGLAGWTESRGWTILRGVLALVAGGFAAGHPALIGTVAAVTVVLLIAAGSIFSGILEIVVAIRERKAIKGEGWMILDGVFSILFGIVLAMAPLFSASLLIRFSGGFAILFGLVAIYCAFQFRKLKSV
ncbi:HdeD family acid-resistance protein [Rosistilla oblonga]|uniref:HdeD family acid-resistance protein n=1 Tax=Rosistilla oblonga TaxID=2527990 RepID=UPI003A96D8CE